LLRAVSNSLAHLGTDPSTHLPDSDERVPLRGA
jgi:hypothetical protein